MTPDPRATMRRPMIHDGDERSHQVDVDDLAKAGDPLVDQRAEERDGGIVDEQVRNRAELGGRALDGGFVRNVGRERDRAVELRRHGTRLCLVDVEHAHPVAAPRGARGQDSADATPGAGDNGALHGRRARYLARYARAASPASTARSLVVRPASMLRGTSTLMGMSSGSASKSSSSGSSPSPGGSRWLRDSCASSSSARRLCRRVAQLHVRDALRRQRCNRGRACRPTGRGAARRRARRHWTGRPRSPARKRLRSSAAGESA